MLCACGIGTAIWWFSSATSFPNQTEDYAQARQHFQTKLIRQGPAPQEGQIEQPPPGLREVPNLSGNLRLRAWASGVPPDSRRRPAVLFLHGGFAFGADDWEQTQPFRDAGFVVMTPALRGENGLPGSYSMFYNEVEDVLAAAETLAQLPYVDSNRLYIAGHSVGGTLTLLASMTSNRFRAAASFCGGTRCGSVERTRRSYDDGNSGHETGHRLLFSKSSQCLPARSAGKRAPFGIAEFH